MTAVSSVRTGAQLPTLHDRDAVHDERDRVAAMLGELAEDPRFLTRHHELRALAKAVGSGGNREAVWRGIQLEQTFTPETTVRLTPRRRRRVAGGIGVLAAIAVFLPVWWTWFGFQAATDAYQRVLAAGRAEGESFLQLWVAGFFGDLAPQHWLPNVALWSMILILSCILLIVGERLMSRSADRADDDEYQECSARLASALNLAQITINSRDVSEPVQGLDVIREAAEELLTAHQQTREATAALHNAAQELEEATSRVAEGLQSSTAALLASFERGVDGLVGSLAAAMDGTTTTLLGSVGGVTQTLESSVANAVGTLNTSVGQVAQASTGMQQAVSASASAQEELAHAAAGLAANTQAMEVSLREQIRQAADAIAREVEQLRNEAGLLSQHTGEVGSSLGHHTSALQHQITELTQIRASLERVSQLGGEHGVLAGAGAR